MWSGYHSSVVVVWSLTALSLVFRLYRAGDAFVRAFVVLLSSVARAHTRCCSVTKRLPVHFILNPGHGEYDLLTFPRPKQVLSPQYQTCKSKVLTTGPPSPLSEDERVHFQGRQLFQNLFCIPFKRGLL